MFNFLAYIVAIPAFEETLSFEEGRVWGIRRYSPKDGWTDSWSEGHSRLLQCSDCICHQVCGQKGIREQLMPS